MDPAGREREQALRAGTTGPGGNSSSLGSLVGNRGPDRGRIVSVPQWQGQNSASSKLVELLAKSRSQTADRLRRLSLLLPTAPAFCHWGSANHAASVHFSFPPEEGERRPCPFSLKGACQRAGVKAGWGLGGKWLAEPLAQGFTPPGGGKGGSCTPGSHSTDPSPAGTHRIWEEGRGGCALLLNPKSQSVL